MESNKFFFFFVAHLLLSGAGGEKLRESWRETVSNLILDLFDPTPTMPKRAEPHMLKTRRV